MDISEDQLASCPLPSLVIAQYPERFFPKARIVPNIIPHSLLSYKPPNQDELSTGADIFFSPTKSVGAFERRWDTKGAPETSAMLKRVAKRTGCSIQIMTGKPLAEVLKEKRKARIVVDDLVTGSYHLTGLEGLAQGKPVLSFLDSRCLYLLQQISESPYCPFINVRLEDAERVLTWLVEHPETCADIGEQGRKWIENNWNENKLINIFTNIYKETISVTEIRECDTNYNAKTKHEEFFNKILPDLVFESRKKNYDKSGVAPNWTGHPANLKR
jgi:hypothetical protein